MNGLHWQETFYGRLFKQTTTPLGLAIPIYSATGLCASGICGLPLWNPPGSGVNVELVSLDINRASGTADFGALMIMGGPLASTGTGTLVSAALWTTPVNGELGGGVASKTYSYNGAGTFTIVAGVVGAPSAAAFGTVESIGNINLEADASTAHGTSGFTVGFNGAFKLSPGQFIYYACTKASVALYCSTLKWKEIPT